MDSFYVVWFTAIGCVVLVCLFMSGRIYGRDHERERICFGYEAAQQVPPSWIECKEG